MMDEDEVRDKMINCVGIPQEQHKSETLFGETQWDNTGYYVGSISLKLVAEAQRSKSVSIGSRQRGPCNSLPKWCVWTS